MRTLAESLSERYWRERANDYPLKCVIPKSQGTVPPGEFEKVATGDFMRCPLRGSVAWGLSNETDLRALRIAHRLEET